MCKITHCVWNNTHSTRFHRGSFRVEYETNSSHFKIFTPTPLVTNIRYAGAKDSWKIVPKKPYTAKLFLWSFKIQELNNFHKLDKYAISLPEVLFGGSLRVLWDRHYKVWILGSEPEFVEWLQLRLPSSQQQQLERAILNEYQGASKSYTTEKCSNLTFERRKVETEVYPHLSGRVAFRWLVW